MIDAEKMEASTGALAGGASKAAVCRNFGIARSTLIGTLERNGWTAPAKGELPIRKRPVADNTLVVQLRAMNDRRLVSVLIIIAVFCGAAYILIASPPRLPISAANGTFANPCCGAVTLRDGLISVENQRLSYVIESDKSGPYVLPKVYVGASNRGFVIRPNGYALKLRLDRTAKPMSLELIDDGPDAATFSFIRTNVR